MDARGPRLNAAAPANDNGCDQWLGSEAAQHAEPRTVLMLTRLAKCEGVHLTAAQLIRIQSVIESA